MQQVTEDTYFPFIEARSYDRFCVVGAGGSYLVWLQRHDRGATLFTQYPGKSPTTQCQYMPTLASAKRLLERLRIVTERAVREAAEETA